MPARNLLKNYPKTKRDIAGRATTKSAHVRELAREFGKEFFDGDRQYGYGGFSYHPRFWQPVIPDFQKAYNLTSASSVLDVGCAKGFMLYDFTQLIPGIHISGIDISDYAISHAIPEIQSFLRVGNAKKLPFPDNSFDLVISINTVHNLPLPECKQAIAEIERVSKKHAFITVDAYRNDKEKETMLAWNLTAKTILSVDDWVGLFDEVGYSGDYDWFIP